MNSDKINIDEILKKQEEEMKKKGITPHRFSSYTDEKVDRKNKYCIQYVKPSFTDDNCNKKKEFSMYDLYGGTFYL